jgi:hypothetical protein
MDAPTRGRLISQPWIKHPSLDQGCVIPPSCDQIFRQIAYRAFTRQRYWVHPVSALALFKRQINLSFEIGFHLIPRTCELCYPLADTASNVSPDVVRWLGLCWLAFRHIGIAA